MAFSAPTGRFASPGRVFWATIWRFAGPGTAFLSALAGFAGPGTAFLGVLAGFAGTGTAFSVATWRQVRPGTASEAPWQEMGTGMAGATRASPEVTDGNIV